MFHPSYDQNDPAKLTERNVIVLWKQEINAFYQLCSPGALVTIYKSEDDKQSFLGISQSVQLVCRIPFFFQMVLMQFYILPIFDCEEVAC